MFAFVFVCASSVVTELAKMTWDRKPLIEPESKNPLKLPFGKTLQTSLNCEDANHEISSQKCTIVVVF